nr:Uma2 family endonuclease [Nocardioides humi]
MHHHRGTSWKEHRCGPCPRSHDVQMPKRVRVPDVMVVTERPSGKITDQVPVVVAEVLSRDTRSIDLVDKWEEYAAFGIAQYWVLDPERRTLRLLRLVDGAWEETHLLDSDNDTAVVTVGDHGSVQLDLGEILGG